MKSKDIKLIDIEEETKERIKADFKELYKAICDNWQTYDKEIRILSIQTNIGEENE